MVRPKNETEGLLLPITKNYETLIHQTHTKPQETLEFKLTQARESFSFEPSIIFSHDSNWMIGLTRLEVYNIILNVTEEDNNFEFYTDSFDEFSFSESKDEFQEILKISELHHIIYNMKK